MLWGAAPCGLELSVAGSVVHCAASPFLGRLQALVVTVEWGHTTVATAGGRQAAAPRDGRAEELPASECSLWRDWSREWSRDAMAVATGEAWTSLALAADVAH